MENMASNRKKHSTIPPSTAWTMSGNVRRPPSFGMDLASNLSMIGPKYVADSTISNFRRIFWLLLILSTISFTIYQIYERIANFLSHPVSASYTIVTPLSIPYPIITICNLNPVKASYIAAKLAENNTINLSFLLDSRAQCRLRNGGFNTSKDEDQVDFTVNQALLEGGLKLNETVIFSLSSHAFEGVLESNFTDIMTLSGRCFQMNSLGLAQVSGRYGGLRLVLNAATHEYMENNLFEASTGFNIFIHHPGLMPDILGGGYRVSPGYEYDIKISQTQYQLLEKPRGVCNKTAGLRYLKDVAYSQSACIEECVADFIFNTCSCKFAIMPGPYPVCRSTNQYWCGICEMIQMSHITEFSNLCQCDQQCEFTNYDFSTVSSQLSDQYLKMISADVLKSMNLSLDSFSTPSTESPPQNHQIPLLTPTLHTLIPPPSPLLQFLRLNIAKVWIYFNQMSYSHIEQHQAYSVWSMLSDIGGAMGLFLGAAIFTVIEALDFVVSYPWDIKRKKRNIPYTEDCKDIPVNLDSFMSKRDESNPL